MATRYGRSLTPDNPINEIVTIAGELEINPKNADDLRRELISKIEKL